MATTPRVATGLDGMSTGPSSSQSNNRGLAGRAGELLTSGLIVLFAACLATYTFGFQLLFPSFSFGPAADAGPDLAADVRVGGGVRLAHEDRELGRSANLAGHLDIGRLYLANGKAVIVIAGWAMNREEPYEPVRICLFENGRLAYGTKTWERNLGVDRSFGTRNAHVGFVLRVPVTPAPGRNVFRVVAVGPDGKYLELDASPGCELSDVTAGRAE